MSTEGPKKLQETFSPTQSLVKLKRNPYRYRRTLPHIQDSVPIFVSFNTHCRWELPPQARTLAMQSCLYEHLRRVRMHAFVIMPEHAHLLFSILYSVERDPPPMSCILGDIKGASSHNINKLLRRKGRVWQEESFDRATRTDEFDYYMNYIIMNPVRRKLVDSPDQYQWLWYEYALVPSLEPCRELPNK
jgi:REP element-mobilizing transposase RayT